MEGTRSLGGAMLRPAVKFWEGTNSGPTDAGGAELDTADSMATTLLPSRMYSLEGVGTELPIMNAMLFDTPVTDTRAVPTVARSAVVICTCN